MNAPLIDPAHRRIVRRTSRKSTLLCALTIAWIGSGCAGRAAPDLALVYDASAQYHGIDRNPIIAVPGILGSMLVDEETGRTVWGAFEPASIDPGDPDGARTFALPMNPDKPLDQSHDRVVSTGVLEQVRIRMLGIPLQVQAYAGVLQTLGAGGYRDKSLGLGGQVDYGSDHYTCFQFGYDWRRDNVESAQRLHEFILQKRQEVKDGHAEHLGLDLALEDVKFDIAAHSMGGLVVRYFLMYGDQPLPEDGSLPELTWAGAKLVDRVIYVGTPNAGSAQTLVQLVEGKKMAPLLPFYPPALLGTFPSTYQLLPRVRHGAVLWDGDADKPVERLMDAGLWDELGWGLASPDQAKVLHVLLPHVDDAAERHRIAIAYLERVLKRAEAFHRALDRPAQNRPANLDQFLVAGDADGTVSHLTVSSRDGVVAVLDEGPGDGTVLRSSALMDERVGGAQAWTPWLQSPLEFESVLFLPDDHLGLTKNPVFRDNVLYWLLEEPRTSGRSS